jgi:hypothetical protein
MSEEILMQAIRALPKKWIVNGTKFTELPNDIVCVVNKKYQPMLYKDGVGWRKIDIKPVDNWPVTLNIKIGSR